MLSITSHMDERDIAQEIIMERMVHSGSFLLVEGKTDIKRFRYFIDSDCCSMVACSSGVKAFKAMRILKKRRFKGAVAALDRDFLDVLGVCADWDDILRSEFHDFDLDWLHTQAVERYILEVGDEEKISAAGGTQAVLNIIHETLRPISVGRFLGAKRVFPFKTSGINVSLFYESGKNLDQDYCLALVAAGYVDASRVDWMIREIRKEMCNVRDDRQMTNGHDACCALGKMLQAEIGNKKVPQTWGSEVESHIRLAFRDEDFRNTAIFFKIIDWEDRNYPYVILRGDLRI